MSSSVASSFEAECLQELRDVGEDTRVGFPASDIASGGNFGAITTVTLTTFLQMTFYVTSVHPCVTDGQPWTCLLYTSPSPRD